MIPSMIEQVGRAAAYAATLRAAEADAVESRKQTAHERMDGKWSVGERLTTTAAARLLGYASSASANHALHKLEKRGYLAKKGAVRVSAANKATVWERIK
jgi:hypothetical protein